MSSRSQHKFAEHVSFRAVAHLVACVGVEGDRTDVAALTRRLRHTPEGVRSIVARAATANLVEAKENVIVLTAAGRKLWGKVKSHESEALAAEPEEFRAYTEYRPRGWLPPRNRAF
jgi:hypothetical protein